jgi:hypothetical protein
VLHRAIAGCVGPPNETVFHGDEDGIGGTGVVASTDGIGRTGLGPDQDSDGIGGTGLWSSMILASDVGIYGVITALEPLTVNGHCLNLLDHAEMHLNGEPTNSGALELGRVVSVLAGLVDGVATAKAIHIHDAVIGPVEQIDDNGRWVAILDQRIAISDSTRFDFASDPKLIGLKTNQVLRVSGLRHVDGSIDASLIQLAASQTQYRIEGWARRIANGQLQIGQLKFSYPIADNATEPNVHVQLNGAVGEEGFVVNHASTFPALAFRNKLDVWIVQGYAITNSTNDTFEFSSVPRIASTALTNKIDLAIEQRVIASIRFGNSTDPVMERIIPAPPPIEGSRFIVPHYSSDGIPTNFGSGMNGVHPSNARDTLIDVREPPAARERAGKLPRSDQKIGILRGAKPIGRRVATPRASGMRPDVRPTIPVRPAQPPGPRVDVRSPTRPVLDLPSGGAVAVPR